MPAWLFVDIPPQLYEAVRELYPQSKPPFRARPFDVQIIGAMVLYEGRIAEMKTGEGKTIVARLRVTWPSWKGSRFMLLPSMIISSNAIVIGPSHFSGHWD